VCKIKLCLLYKPALSAAAENLGQPDGHFGRDTALPVHQLGQRGAGDSESGGGLSDVQAQRLDALAEYKTSGVGRVAHRPDHRVP
jgi:hypothetical protein